MMQAVTWLYPAAMPPFAAAERIFTGSEHDENDCTSCVGHVSDSFREPGRSKGELLSHKDEKNPQLKSCQLGERQTAFHYRGKPATAHSTCTGTAT